MTEICMWLPCSADRIPDYDPARASGVSAEIISLDNEVAFHWTSPPLPSPT